MVLDYPAFTIVCARMLHFTRISRPALVVVWFITFCRGSLAFNSEDYMYFVQQGVVKHLDRSAIQKELHQTQHKLKQTPEQMTWKEDSFQYLQDAGKQLQETPQTKYVQATDDLVTKLSIENMELHARIQKLEMEVQSLRDGKLQLTSAATDAFGSKEDRRLKFAKQNNLVKAAAEASEEIHVNAEHKLNQCYKAKTKIRKTLQECILSQSELMSTNRQLWDSFTGQATGDKNQMNAATSQAGRRCQQVIDGLLAQKDHMNRVNLQLTLKMEDAAKQNDLAYQDGIREGERRGNSLKTALVKAGMERDEAYEAGREAGRRDGKQKEDKLKTTLYKFGSLVKNLSAAEAKCRTEMEQFEGLLGQVEALKQQMSVEGDTNSSPES